MRGRHRRSCAATCRVGAAIASVLVTLNIASAANISKAQSFGDWSVYVDDEAPHKFCFVTSEPKSTAPAGASRDQPRAYISAWPQDGIKSELSFRMGFPIKAAVQGTATVPPANFKLFASEDRAYVGDATEELKLVEAMRKGSELSVASTSERGTLVTDTYSLAGLGDALQSLQKTCF